MRYIFGMLVAVAMFASTTPLSAQEHKRVEVTKNYMHEVSSAQKIVAPTDINDAPVIEPEIKYNVNPETWQIELEDHNFNPASASYWDDNRTERFFAKIAAGLPLVTDAALRYAAYNTRLGYFGVGVDHDANFAARCNGYGEEFAMARSYSMSNGVHVAGGVIAGRQMFEARADYANDIVNRYGLMNPDRLYFHDANLRLRYGDDFVNLSRLNFGIEAEGGYWRQHLPAAEDVLRVGEFNTTVGVNLARDFQGNKVGVKLGFGLWQGDDHTNYRDMAISVGANYGRSFGIVSLEAELQYMYDKVSGRSKASHFIMPAAKLNFDFGKVGVRPYIEVATSVKHNGLESLYDQNEYIAFVPMQGEFNKVASTLSYDLHFGISGADKASKVAYRVYLGSSFIRNQMFWYINEVGTFGFAQGDNTRLFAGAEVEYHPVGGLKLAASVRGHLDNASSQYVVSDPKIVASVSAEYRLKRWVFGVSGDFKGARSWSGITIDEEVYTEPFKAPAIFDLSANVAFRATNRVELYVNGCNLLNQKIFDYAYYYRNALGVMAGVKIDF